MGEFLQHLAHLLLAAERSLVASMGTTNLALLVGILPFVVSFLYRLFIAGWTGVKDQFSRTLEVGIIYALTM